MSESRINNELRKDQASTNMSTKSSLSDKEINKSDGIGMLARVSTLSWDLVVPIVGGVLLGTYIDKRTGSELRWTLSLLVLGIIIAFANLYNLYMDHKNLEIESQDEQSDDEVSGDNEK